MRSTENQIAQAVVDYLETVPGGVDTIAHIVAAIPNSYKLSTEDLAQSPTRLNEAVWEQQVRNITSHKQTPGNYIHDGLLVPVSGGLSLPGAAGSVSAQANLDL